MSVMQKTIIRICATLCLSGLSAGAWSQVTVTDSWARATFPMAETGAVYLTLHNSSDNNVRLESVRTSSDIAEKVQLHASEMSGEMMKMREHHHGVVVPAHSKVMFKPGGDHIMLVGLSQGLAEGTTVPLTLTFSDNTTVSVDIKVTKDHDVDSHHHH